jgi:hypothetical protein
VRGRRNTRIRPIEATAREITKIANEARPRRSAIDWHCWVNVFHCRCAVAFDAGGSGPAPIEPGSTRASSAVSDPVLGPQVPPTAGVGNAVSIPAAAYAVPKQPMKTKRSTRAIRAGDCFITDPFERL